MTARINNGLTDRWPAHKGGQPHRQRGSASPHPGGQHGGHGHAAVL